MLGLTGRLDTKTRGLFCLLLLVLFQPWAKAQDNLVPALGSPVPSRVLPARLPRQQCLTDLNHHDPCASVKIKGVHFTIAWSSQTKAITYVFTDDSRFVTDSELVVRGDCALWAKTESRTKQCVI